MINQNLLKMSTTSTYNVEWNSLLGSFETTYPLFLQNKNISSQTFSETITFMSERVAKIQKSQSHLVQFFFWFFSISLLTAFFTGAIIFNVLYNNTESSRKNFLDSILKSILQYCIAYSFNLEYYGNYCCNDFCFHQK
jgi:hypothetical protein